MGVQKVTSRVPTRKSIHHTHPRYEGEYEKYTVILTQLAGVSMENTLSYQGEYDSVFFILTQEHQPG